MVSYYCFKINDSASFGLSPYFLPGFHRVERQGGFYNDTPRFHGIKSSWFSNTALGITSPLAALIQYSNISSPHLFYCLFAIYDRAGININDIAHFFCQC